MEPIEFGNMKVITSTHYNRPDCTKQMISHLVKCKGIENYILLCGVEPGFPEVIEELNQYPYRKMVFINENLLGCWGNKLAIIEQGFKLGKYVIHLEDDVILAKDSLKYFEWAKSFEANNSIFSVSAFSNKQNPENMSLVLKDNHYSPLAWATWKNRYNELVTEGWDGSDVFINKSKGNRFHVKPSVTRAKHIGYHHGVGTHPDVLKILENTGQVPFAYAGLANLQGDFVKDINAYVNALQKQLITEPNPDVRKALQHQIRVARTGPLNRQILVNSKNEEWIQLNPNTVKSKAVEEYFKYEITVWADDLEAVNEYYL